MAENMRSGHTCASSLLVRKNLKNQESRVASFSVQMYQAAMWEPSFSAPLLWCWHMHSLLLQNKLPSCRRSQVGHPSAKKQVRQLMFAAHWQTDLCLLPVSCLHEWICNRSMELFAVCIAWLSRRASTNHLCVFFLFSSSVIYTYMYLTVGGVEGAITEELSGTLIVSQFVCPLGHCLAVEPLQFVRDD